MTPMTIEYDMENPHGEVYVHVTLDNQHYIERIGFSTVMEFDTVYWLNATALMGVQQEPDTVTLLTKGVKIVFHGRGRMVLSEARQLWEILLDSGSFEVKND